MPESNKCPQGSFTDCVSIIKVRRWLYRKDTLLFTSHPVSSLFFCLFICPCFWIHPIISVMLSHVSAFPSGLESSESWSFKKHAKDVTGGEKIKYCWVQLKYTKNSKGMWHSTPQKMKSHYTLSGEMFCQESYTVYSVCLDSQSHALVVIIYSRCSQLGVIFQWNVFLFVFYKRFL